MVSFIFLRGHCGEVVIGSDRWWGGEGRNGRVIAQKGNSKTARAEASQIGYGSCARIFLLLILMEKCAATARQ